MSVLITINERLACQYCLSDKLKHASVAVHDRKKNDLNPLFVSVANKEVLISRENTNNPSPKEGGLRVLFWCDNCIRHSTLNIYQHAGNTLVNWEK